MKTLLITALLLGSFGTLTVKADEFSDLAQAKCTKCHNPDSGQARIDGQEADFMVLTMVDYKNRTRKSELMTKRVVNLSDAQIKGLADYFSKLPVSPGIAGDPALIAAGKDLYENGVPAAGVQACADCHGKAAEGRGFGSGLNPRLSGQYSDFFISQMEAYKTGAIANQPVMADIAKKMTAEQIKACAEYVQSL